VISYSSFNSALATQVHAFCSTVKHSAPPEFLPDPDYDADPEREAYLDTMEDYEPEEPRAYWNQEEISTAAGHFLADIEVATPKDRICVVRIFPYKLDERGKRIFQNCYGMVADFNEAEALLCAYITNDVHREAAVAPSSGGTLFSSNTYDSIALCYLKEYATKKGVHALQQVERQRAR